MTIEFYDNRGGRAGTPFVTVDKFGRICLSAKTREMLGCRYVPTKLYVGYDKANKRIGLAKPEVVRLTDTTPMNFDIRGYGHAGAFLRKYQIPHDKTYRYVHVGKEGGALTFELDGYDAPDAEFQPTVVKPRKGRPKKDA